MDFEIDAEKPLSEVFCGRREKEMLSLFRWLSTADTRLCRAEWRWQNPGVKEAFSKKRRSRRRARNLAESAYVSATPVGTGVSTVRRRAHNLVELFFVSHKIWEQKSLPPRGRGTTKWWKEPAVARIQKEDSNFLYKLSLSRAPFVFCSAKSTSLPEGGEYIHDFFKTKV